MKSYDVSDHRVESECLMEVVTVWSEPYYTSTTLSSVPGPRNESSWHFPTTSLPSGNCAICSATLSKALQYVVFPGRQKELMYTIHRRRNKIIDPIKEYGEAERNQETGHQLFHPSLCAEACRGRREKEESAQKELAFLGNYIIIIIIGSTFPVSRGNRCCAWHINR